MKITVEIRNVYGNELVYPVCDTAKLLARLCNTKTFTKSNLEVIKSLGYEVIPKAPELV